MSSMEKIYEAAGYIKERSSYNPKIGLILGSGLGEFADRLENADVFDYKTIPNMPVSTVEGHKGRFVVTEELICMQGRFHFYEGYSMEEVTFPIRVMKLLGVETIIVTNAAGGINSCFLPGDLMLINDHINFMGTNPLIGRNLDHFGERFPDMSNCYNKKLGEIAKEAGKDKGVALKEGVYCAMTGPNYETPAEVRMIKVLGGDAVGMSTVPEVVTAVHSKMNVIGISCITNMASGVTENSLDHQEVIETSERVKEKFILLIEGIIEKLINNKL